MSVIETDSQLLQVILARYTYFGKATNPLNLPVFLLIILWMKAVEYTLKDYKSSINEHYYHEHEQIRCMMNKSAIN